MKLTSLLITSGPTLGFVIDSKTRAICGYNISNHRGMQPALALLYNTFGNPSDKAKHPDLITDGNPAYDSAVMAYNDLIKNDDSKLTKRTVIGLKKTLMTKARNTEVSNSWLSASIVLTNITPGQGPDLKHLTALWLSQRFL